MELSDDEETGVRGKGWVLLTGVPLCFSLPSGDGTILVCEQDLLQLTHLRSQWRHLVLRTHRIRVTSCVKCRARTLLKLSLTWSCRFVCVSSSAFFSRDDTHSFLFWRQRVAAARFRSRNFCLRSSGSSSVVLLRRWPPPPPLQLPPACTACWGWGGWEGCICCATGDNWHKKGRKKKTNKVTWLCPKP